MPFNKKFQFHWNYTELLAFSGGILNHAQDPVGGDGLIPLVSLPAPPELPARKKHFGVRLHRGGEAFPLYPIRIGATRPSGIDPLFNGILSLPFQRPNRRTTFRGDGSSEQR